VREPIGAFGFLPFAIHVEHASGRQPEFGVRDPGGGGGAQDVEGAFALAETGGFPGGLAQGGDRLRFQSKPGEPMPLKPPDGRRGDGFDLLRGQVGFGGGHEIGRQPGRVGVIPQQPGKRFKFPPLKQPARPPGKQRVRPGMLGEAAIDPVGGLLVQTEGFGELRAPEMEQRFVSR
jgi:hypothetical protein